MDLLTAPAAQREAARSVTGGAVTKIFAAAAPTDYTVTKDVTKGTVMRWFFRCPVCGEDHEWFPRECAPGEAHAYCPQAGERVHFGEEYTYSRSPPVGDAPVPE